MYFEGTINNANELLDLIKTNAVTEGWEALRDTKTLFTKIPSGLDGITCSVTLSTVTGYFDDNMATNGTATLFTLTLPLSLMPNGYYVRGSGAFSLKIEGRRADNTFATLVETSTFTDNETLDNTEEFTQYRFIITSPANIKELNLLFDTDVIQSQELILYSKGYSQDSNIYIGFKAVRMQEEAISVSVSTFTGYSDSASFEAQPSFARIYTYWQSKAMNYFLSINKQRLCGAVKIYEPLDPYEKNEVYQIIYLGYLTAYGSPSALPSPYAIMGSGVIQASRWSAVDTDMPSRPIVFTPYPRYVKSLSLIQNFTEANMPYTNDTEGNLFSMPVTIYTNYNNAQDGFSGGVVFERCLIGEYDGILKVIATNQTKSEDTLTIGSDEYIIIQNGKKKSLVDYFAIRKN